MHIPVTAGRATARQPFENNVPEQIMLRSIPPFRVCLDGHVDRETNPDESPAEPRFSSEHFQQHTIFAPPSLARVVTVARFRLHQLQGNPGKFSGLSGSSPPGGVIRNV